jgi:hypothetical protein
MAVPVNPHGWPNPYWALPSQVREAQVSHTHFVIHKKVSLFCFDGIAVCIKTIKISTGRHLVAMSISGVQQLYTNNIDSYHFFVSAFRSPQGVRCLLQSCRMLRCGMRVLDAGCGFGMVTFALLEVLRKQRPRFPNHRCLRPHPGHVEPF